MRPQGMPEGMEPPMMPGDEGNPFEAYQKAMEGIDLNQLLEGVDLNELLKDQDLNQLLSGFFIKDLLSEEQIAEHFAGVDLEALEGFNPMRGGFGGFGGGGPRRLESSAEVATTDFMLTQETTGFTNVVEAK